MTKVTLNSIDWTAQESHSDEVAIVYLDIQDWKTESGELMSFVKPIHIHKNAEIEKFCIHQGWYVSLKETDEKFVLSVFEDDRKIKEIETSNSFDKSPQNNTYSF